MRNLCAAALPLNIPVIGLIKPFGIEPDQAKDCAQRAKGDRVRFGSKADMCSASTHVRFTPKSGHWRGDGF